MIYLLAVFVLGALLSGPLWVHFTLREVQLREREALRLRERYR